jgi:alpha-tubulin suppressor-like RCC1 family protein
MDKDRPGAVVGPRGLGELRGVTAVAGGNVHSLAVGEGGHVWAWGDNIWGQLGDGTSTGPEHCLNAGRPPSASNVCSKVPVEVVGPGHKRHLTGVSAVAAGVDNSIAVGRDGTVWSWGLNDLGQLGDGSSTGPKTCEPYSNYGPVACSPTPVEVVGPHGTGHLSHIVAVTGGADFAVALRADGTVWAWGSDAYDALGQRQISAESCYSPFAPIPIPCSTRPVEVAGPGGEGHLGRISAIAAESSPQGLHVLALRADGTVWAWGVDDKGQLGNGVSETDSLVPVQVVGPGGHGKLTGVVGVAAGGGFSLARRADGSVWAWGLNAAGELGIGNDTGPELCTTSSYPCSTKPVQVLGPGGRGTLEHVSALAAGQLHSLALRRTQPAH